MRINIFGSSKVNDNFEKLKKKNTLFGDEILPEFAENSEDCDQKTNLRNTMNH